MSRRRLRTLAVLVALSALLTGVTGVAGAAEPAPPEAAAPAEAAAPDRSGDLVLVNQPAWEPPDGTFVLELRIDAAADEEIVVTSHRAVTSRSALARTLEGRSLGVAEGWFSVPVGSLPVDADGDRLLTVGVQGIAPPDAGRIVPGRTGVYPLDIQLRRRGAPAVARFVTPLVVLAPGLVPLTLAWVWRFDATPGRLPDGRIRPAAARAVGPGGRLVRMAEAASAFSDVPLTLAPTPETIETWAAAAQGDRGVPASQETANALARLRAASGQATRQMLGGTYVAADLADLQAADLESEADRQLRAGRDALAEGLGAPPAATTFLAGPLDPPSLGRLRRHGVERLVMPPETLEPMEQRLTPGRPFGIGGRGRPFDAAVSDPGLADLLAGDEAPALRAARFLAALSLVALEAPREPRGVVVVTPPHWDAPAALLSSVLTGLRGHPAVRADTLDGFFASVAPDVRDGRPLVRALAVERSDDPDADADGVRAARRRLAAFTKVVGDGQPPARAVDRAILLSQAAVLAGDERGRRPSPDAYLAAANRHMRRVTGRVQGPDGQRVTLTARRASIPISLLNANPRPIQVLVRLESDQLRFPRGSERLLTLPPENTTASFAVEARAPGAFPLVVTVTSPDGELLVNRSELTIRSTVVSGVGALLTAGAGLFLLVWWGNNLRRSRRRLVLPAG